MKEPEVPGQAYVTGEVPEAYQRQLSCGCWVPLDGVVRVCDVHGELDVVHALAREPTVPELQAVIRELRLRIDSLRKDLRDCQRSWLDEVAKAMAQGMLAAQFPRLSIEAIPKAAYNLAQAILDEGKKRRGAE